MENIENIALHR